MHLTRALTFALPLSLALWAGLFVVARDTMPASYRHAIKADAHYALAHVRHGMRQALVASRWA